MRFWRRPKFDPESLRAIRDDRPCGCVYIYRWDGVEGAALFCDSHRLANASQTDREKPTPQAD